MSGNMAKVSVFVKNDHTKELFDKLESKYQGALEAAGMHLESAAKLLAPVDTGNLRNSIGVRLQGKREAQVGTDVEYGKYQELGTKYMNAPQPFLVPAAENNLGQIASIIEQALK